jgi:hypothetical protein
LTNAINSLKFLNGLPVQGTRTTVAPGTQGNFGLSTLDEIAGLTSLLGGAFTGSGGDKFANLGKNLSDFFNSINIKNPFSSTQ